jgi:hypothetical protein
VLDETDLMIEIFEFVGQIGVGQHEMNDMKLIWDNFIDDNK